MKKIIVLLLAIFSFSLVSCSDEKVVIEQVYQETNKISVNDAYVEAKKSSCKVISEGKLVLNSSVFTAGRFYSGIVVKKDLFYTYILTSRYAGNVSDIITIETEEKNYSGSVTSIDEKNLLALVKVSGDILEEVSYNTDELKKGDDAILISQYSKNLNYLNKGYISYYDEYKISTDAPTNSNSLGAGIYDLNGKLLGIVCDEQTKESSNYELNYYQGICHGVRASLLDKIVNQMLLISNVERPLMGITVVWTDSNLSSLSENNYVFPDDELYEVISDITKNSNGARAGFKVGDVLISVNDVLITSSNVLTSVMRTSVANSSLVFKIKRYNEATNLLEDLEVVVTLFA